MNQTPLMALRRRGVGLVLWLGLAAVQPGCEEYFTNAGTLPDAVTADGAAAGGQDLFNGAGVGEACDSDAACRSGLTCGGGKCAPSGAKVANDACLLSAECEGELQCGFFGFCVPTAGRDEGAACTSVSDCAKGLFCDLQGVAGFCAAPAASAKDLYGSCKGTNECLPGLHCSSDGECMPGSVTLSTELFPGVACPVREEEDLPFQARNRIPKAGDAATYGFYSTPFPSDLRLSADGGKVDVSEHPRPGTGLIGLDLIGNVIDGVNKEMSGFSVAPTVYFRWTRPVDTGSLVKSGPQQNIFFVNLKTGAAVEFQYSFKAARNKYICANWLAIHPTWRRSLDSKTTYGVYVTDSVRASLAEGAELKDKLPVQGDDLTLLLAASAPGDAAKKTAWDRFASLRAHLGNIKLSPNKVVAATVFTTQDPTRFMRQFSELAWGSGVKMPAIKDNKIHLCGTDKGPSPCATLNFSGKGSDPRDCPATPSPDFHEYHFKLRLPVFQTGARPYLKSGGELALNGPKVKVSGEEWVCAALTIPKKNMPAGGWPVVLYSHGTGGSFRSGVSQMGPQLSKLVDGSKSAATAILGIDGMMHGPRRGDAAHALNLDPGPLFYNFANPPAAKGNFYQGAADNHALIRYVRSAQIKLPNITAAARFDSKKVMYMGHSQGGTTGPLFAPYAHDAEGSAYVASYVFSGAGAGLVFSLLNKTSPEDATIGIKLALQEVDLDEYHPALALFQYYFDEVDPLIYAGKYYDEPNSQPVHVLHTYGVGDTYTPPETSRVFAAATGGLLLRPDGAGDWFDMIADLGMKVENHTKTVQQNIKVTFGGKSYAVTGVTVEHNNDAAKSTDGKPYNGHFVAFKDKVCNKQVGSFIATTVTTGVPKVPHK